MVETLEPTIISSKPISVPHSSTQEAKSNPDNGHWPRHPEGVQLVNDLEHNVRFGFAALQTVEGTNPRIQELREYGAGLEQQFAILRSNNPITPSLADLLIGRIPKEDRKACFEGAILRIRKETSYLQELEAERVVSGLINGFQEGKYGAFVKFFEPDTPLGKLFTKTGTLAAYNPNFDVALVNGRPASEDAMWKQLVTAGTLPRIVESLDHELVHDLQTDKVDRAILWAPVAARMGMSYFSAHLLGMAGPIITRVATFDRINPLMRELNNLIKGDLTLHEIQAYDAASSSPTAGDDQLDEPSEIVAHVVTNYKERGISAHDRIIKAFVAYDSVHTLRILGLDDREIGRLVSKARYDAKSESYPRLKDAINQRLKDWGLPEEHSQERTIVLNALKMKRELELHVERQKARQIAADTLKNDAGYPNIS